MCSAAGKPVSEVLYKFGTYSLRPSCRFSTFLRASRFKITRMTIVITGLQYFMTNATMFYVIKGVRLSLKRYLCHSGRYLYGPIGVWDDTCVDRCYRKYYNYLPLLPGCTKTSQHKPAHASTYISRCFLDFFASEY